jgi:Retrotransposon gag protein
VPESHKARLAVLHFGDDALSWYRSTTVNQTKLSWSELVAAVKKRLVQSISTGAKR